MISKLKNAFYMFRENVFKRYPVTMWAVWIATALAAILYDRSAGESETLREILIWCWRADIFIWIFAAGSLLTEQLFEAFGKRRYIGYGISCIASLLFTSLGTAREWLPDNVQEEVLRVMVCYLTWVLVSSVYFMHRRNEQSFAEYCMRAFGGVMKTTLVYGLFALGVALIIVIFNILIYDTDEFVLRLEIVLAGWIYVPGAILALSDTQKPIGRFFKLIIKFVLLPLTIAAFVIIYLYIGKCVITWELPSNEVFPILAWLFAIALPIWTMGTTQKEESRLGRAAAVLPYVFIPFIFLQMLCVGLRVRQYGLTHERYFACALILFEISYLLLYTLRKERFLAGMLFVAAAFVTLLSTVPYVRADDAVYYTQKAYLVRTLSADASEREDLSRAQKERLGGAFQKVRYDKRGEKYIEALPKRDRDWLDELGEEIGYGGMNITHYYSARCTRNALPVGGFEMLYKVHGDLSGDRLKESLRSFSLKESSAGGQQDTQVFTVNLLDFAEAFESQTAELEYDETNAWLREHGEVRFADGTMLIIESVNLQTEYDEYTSFSVDGYYLR